MLSPPLEESKNYRRLLLLGLLKTAYAMYVVIPNFLRIPKMFIRIYKEDRKRGRMEESSRELKRA